MRELLHQKIALDERKFSFYMLTLACILFDVYQMVKPGNTVLDLITLFGFIVVLFSTFKWLSDGAACYAMSYCIPVSLLTVGTYLIATRNTYIDGHNVIFSGIVIFIESVLPFLGALVVTIVLGAYRAVKKDIGE